MDSQEPDPKLICDWHLRADTAGPLRRRCPWKRQQRHICSRTRKAFAAQLWGQDRSPPGGGQLTSNLAERREEGAGGDTEPRRHPCSASGQRKAPPARLAEWGQAARDPRAVGLSVEVKGLVVLMEGAKFNLVPSAGNLLSMFSGSLHLPCWS